MRLGFRRCPPIPTLRRPVAGSEPIAENRILGDSARLKATSGHSR